MQSESAKGPTEDAALVDRVRAGDRASFETLVLRYQDRVYNACWRICRHADDAADLTQDTFIRAFRAIGGFQGGSTFYTWIFRIAVNLALSHRRKAKLRLAAPLNDDAHYDGGREPAATEEPVDGPAGNLGEFVGPALEAIDPHHRAVVVLRDIEGFDYHQIAEVLEIPVGTVKSRVHRARVALREMMEQMRDRPKERAMQ